VRFCSTSLRLVLFTHEQRVERGLRKVFGEGYGKSYYVRFRNTAMKELKEFWNTYSRYFVDIWQYLIIIVIFIIAALVIL